MFLLRVLGAVGGVESALGSAPSVREDIVCPVLLGAYGCVPVVVVTHPRVIFCDRASYIGITGFQRFPSETDIVCDSDAFRAWRDVGFVPTVGVFQPGVVDFAGVSGAEECGPDIAGPFRFACRSSLGTINQTCQGLDYVVADVDRGDIDKAAIKRNASIIVVVAGNVFAGSAATSGTATSA